MVVGFSTTCAISAYHHWSCEFKPRSWRGVLDTTICDKVWLRLATGRWFSPDTLVSSTNKTDCHDITEILLKHHKPNLWQLLCHKEYLYYAKSSRLKLSFKVLFNVNWIMPIYCAISIKILNWIISTLVGILYSHVENPCTTALFH